VPQNLTEAARIFRFAAVAGGPGAQVEYGLVLWRGQGVDKNLSEAARYFGLAADAGMPWGGWYLGQVLEEPGDLQNFTEAARLFADAGEKDCEPARASLGNLLVRGMGIEKNITRGVELLLAAERKKSVDAMLFLGRIAEEGLVGEKDIVEAFGKFEAAANQSAAEEALYPVVPDRRGKEAMAALIGRAGDEIAEMERRVEAGEIERKGVVARLLEAAKTQAAAAAPNGEGKADPNKAEDL
jgi:TPR repeat protein